VDWRTGGGTGHYLRQLPFFPQAGHRGLSGSGVLEPGPDSLAGSGDYRHLCFRRSGGILAVASPAPNHLIGGRSRPFSLICLIKAALYAQCRALKAIYLWLFPNFFKGLYSHKMVWIKQRK
jgi:hypothetical protein